MNWEAVFIVAAIAAVYGFGRDILRGILDKRKVVIKGAQDEIMQPLQIHGVVLADTEKAITLQSALLVQSRTDLADEQKRRIEAEARADTLQQRLTAADERERELLIQLGRAYGRANRPDGGDGV